MRIIPEFIYQNPIRLFNYTIFLFFFRIRVHIANIFYIIYIYRRVLYMNLYAQMNYSLHVLPAKLRCISDVYNKGQKGQERPRDSFHSSRS